ncbi:MAG TPA: DUF177 domain-containing protein [Gemmatimonadales bacterium]|jgi:uncharacterized protein|nr:DUF177 domain-containing protein [Gemmatimonadales bacterium]
MLQVDLRELARGPVETRANLAGDDPLFEGLGCVLADPVTVAGRLQAAGPGRFYWRGSLATRVAGECRRCLTPVTVPVTAQIDALFAQDPDALEDPNSYSVDPAAIEIDLRPAVREELALAAPSWIVCREECRGLCPHCGRDLNAGPCGCPPAPDPGRRPALAALKDKLHH